MFDLPHICSHVNCMKFSIASELENHMTKDEVGRGRCLIHVIRIIYKMSQTIRNCFESYVHMIENQTFSFQHIHENRLEDVKRQILEFLG